MPKSSKPVKQKKPEKILTTKQKVIFITVSILIIIALCFIGILLNGYHLLSNQGFTSNDALIRSYLTAVDNNDKNTIKQSFCVFATDYNDIVFQQCQYADSYHAQLSFNKDSVKIESTDCTSNDEIKSSINIPADTIMYNIVGVNATKINNNITYNTNDEYQIITYKYQEKWYIWSLSSTETVISGTDKDGNDIDISKFQNHADLSSDKTMIVGNETVGFIIIGKDWIDASAGNDDNLAESIIAYTDPDNTMAISLSAITSETDAASIADETYKNLSNDQSISDLMIETDSIGTYPASKLSYTMNGSYFVTWIFDAPVKDAYTHCIKIESTKRTLNKATDYIETFHFA